MNHHPVEKEAYAIVESIRYWRHYLAGRQFSLITDQRSVSYIYDIKHSSKIKKDKIEIWRVELACHSFDTTYCPGKENVAPDTLTRVICSVMTPDNSVQLHNSLSYPVITRMAHFVQTKNLPVSIEQIRSVVNSCPICAECKPRFYKPTESHLIKQLNPLRDLMLTLSVHCLLTARTVTFSRLLMNSQGLLLPYRVVMSVLQSLSSHSVLYFQFLGCQFMSILTEDNLLCLEN